MKWVKTFDHGGRLAAGGVIAASGRLVVSLGDEVVFLSPADGAVLATYRDSMGMPNSPPTADGSGNIYVATYNGVHAIDINGSVVWQKYIYETSASDPEFYQMPPPTLSPRGVLYGISYHHTLNAIRASDGAVLWTLPAVTGLATAGAGDLLLVDSSPTTLVVDVSKRTMVGTLMSLVGEPANFTPAYSTSGGAWGALGYSFMIVAALKGGDVSYDLCSGPRWFIRDGNAERVNLIGSGERLMAVSATYNLSTGIRTARDRLIAYDSTGRIVAGPAESAVTTASSADAEIPTFSGADGTTYTIFCQSGAQPSAKLIAYSAELAVLWQLDVGPGCPNGPGVLADDGTIYLTRPADGNPTTELVAIQSTSPGLAPSSWPTARHDNRGTSWLGTP